MLTCAIVDDEEIPRTLLATLLQQIPSLEVKQVFPDPLQALSWLQNHQVDLVFMDIEMAPLSGLDLARSLLHPPLIIFTTGHPEYAVEGFDIDAVDYVLKPYSLPRLLQSVQKVERRKIALQKSAQEEPDTSPFHFFKSGTETHKIRTHDLVYVEGASNYAKLYCLDGSMIMVYRTLSDLQEKLGSEGLVRVHRSFLVNLAHIKKIERHQVWVDTKPVPLGKTYRRQFLEQIPAEG